MNRAYTFLDIKAMEDDGEYVTVKGIASTPTPDFGNDIVDPMGAEFATPMPLLWQHKHDKPVGHVTFASPTKDGIPFEAKIPRIKEAGTLKDRVDEAVQSLKYRLVAAVSIGFSPVDGFYEYLKNGGTHYKRWRWHELSLVTIGMNSEALVTAVKSIDQTHLPASGLKMARPIEKSPGVTGKKRKPILLHKR
jgi:HK97 family phage prohead protease